MLFVWLSVILLIAAPSEAQLWSGYLNSSRAVDWTTVPYAPPTFTVQCTPTITTGMSVSAINTQIAGCADNTYVLFAAGTFNVGTTSIQVIRSNVELRGSGPSSTIISGVPTDSPFGTRCIICITAGILNVVYPFYDSGGSTQLVVTGGATPGSTSVTVADNSALSVGKTIALWMDNEDNSSSYLPVIQCGSFMSPGVICLHLSGNDANSGIVQFVRITSLPNGTTVNFTPALYYSRWANNRNPVIAYINFSHIQNSGVSNMTVNNTAPDLSNQNAGIAIGMSDGAWITNVRFNQCGNTCITLRTSRKISVFHNYLYQNLFSDVASSAYGVKVEHVTDAAIYNNIVQQIQAPFLSNGGGEANIFAYNYTINNEYHDSQNGDNWQNASIFSNHADGAIYTLVEGNDIAQFNLDWAHGTGAYNTLLRNYISGQDYSRGTLTTNDNVVIYNTAYTRFNNILGNVLGTVGLHNAYQGIPGATAGIQYDRTIYHLGFCGGSFTFTDCGSLHAADSTVVSSLMRWFNLDTVTNTIRCQTGEVPSDLSQPASCTAPSSFWLNAKPSWFGSVPFPPIGPDVSTGTVHDRSGAVRTQVNRIPARVCYEDVMHGPSDGQGAILSFDANTCYSLGGGDTTPPAAPQNLRITQLQ